MLSVIWTDNLNYQDIEKLKSNLSNELPTLFGKSKLFCIKQFYDTLLSTQDDNLIEAYSLDFVEEYLICLQEYTPYHISPSKSTELFEQIEKLKLIPNLSDFKNIFTEINFSIKTKLQHLHLSLNGYEKKGSRHSLLFPLIERHFTSQINCSYGTIESINILIRKTKNQDRFVYVPSEKKIEERLLNQSKTSFQLALDYFTFYKKRFTSHHEILIYFENLSANYEGNSLGVALTIGFINHLSQLYNLPYVTKVKSNSASTGSVDSNGVINSVGKEAIEKKVETVFFSEVDTFIIPKEDEYDAKEYFNKLKLIYPNRKLRLVAVEDVNELLYRRDLVEIKKQNIIIRTGREIKRNWIASLLFILFFSTLVFVLNKDFDDNPALLEHQGQILQVKNKSGRILWTKMLGGIPSTRKTTEIPNSYAQLIDINDDGINEIVLNVDPGDNRTNLFRNNISCWSNSGIKLWHYSFKDPMESLDEKLTTTYSQLLLGYYAKNGKKYLICSANNRDSFGSAIFTLDLLTGNRVFKTFWHPGFVMEGIVKTMDTKKKLIFAGLNNQFERIALGVIDINNLFGQINSTMHYHYKNVPLATLDSYIIYPKTDYSLSENIRIPGIAEWGFRDLVDESKILFTTSESTKGGTLLFNTAYNWKDIDIIIGSDLRVLRDSLVVHGKLKPPFTDTPAYRNILQEQILYYNGKEFLKRAQIK